jgi:hypothetical protein
MNEVTESILIKIRPAIDNLLKLKSKFPDEPEETFKLHIDATYADIIKIIYLETGCMFDVNSDYFK